jgi:NAD(P)H dehydrogenase (quinone)
MHSDQGSGAPSANHLVILAHPDASSFNRAIADRYCAAVRALGHDAKLRDLYDLGFDPRLYADHRAGLDTNKVSGDVAGEMGLLRQADAVVFVYPIWFGMPPAMIKGYVDRVLGYALTPDDITKHVPDAILAGRHFASFTTSATIEPWLEQQGQLAALKTTFDAYLMQIFGMIDAGHTHFSGVITGLSASQAAGMLANVVAKATEICAAIETRRKAIRTRPLLGADVE